MTLLRMIIICSNTLQHVDVMVIGRWLNELHRSPFLNIGSTQPAFQADGNSP